MSMIGRPNINLQPHLGRVKNNYKPQDNMGGYLTIAKVTKVHHRNGTADVQIVRSRDVITSSESNEGRFGVRTASPSAHFDSVQMTSSGVIEPLQDGQLVILAFLDGYKNEPIILGSFHDTWRTENNILVDKYPLRPSRFMDDHRESLKYLRVTPSQFYHKVDGIGAVEISHPSKTFLKIDPDLDGNISDSHSSFDHKDLSEKDPLDYETRRGKTEETLLPVKLLFSHRNTWMDDKTSWTKFYIDTTGLYRITRDNNDGKLSFIESDEEGTYRIRRQLDSDQHDEGSQYTEIKLSQDGSVSISKVSSGGTTSIGIDDSDNVTLTQRSGSYIKLEDNGDIIIQASGLIHLNDSTGVGQ